jgi:phosphatidylserine decarboxylase
MKKSAVENVQFRVGKWLPSDQIFLERWLKNLVNEVSENFKPLHPVIESFKQLIEDDPELYMLFNQMFEQVPAKYTMSPSGKPQVRDYHQMLQMINAVMTKAPEYNSSGLVGLPINAILDWSMGTSGGFAAFLNIKVNAQLKKILNEWGVFLKSKESREVLNEKGWFSEEGLKGLCAMDPFLDTDTIDPKQNFIDNFKCDPLQPYWGFNSWDDFFTREFNEGKRPVASPNDDRVIVNACEAAPYRVTTNVERYAEFWIKAQPYSLQHMLANDPLTDKFVGGSVYQAFLSAKSYHRWHAPLNGTIVKAYVVDGTYYSETLAEAYDPSGNKESQGYITEVATRALIFIEADNPDIGLMCVMPVGMAEVSSCEITVYEGQRVKKGDQLGLFHFGGSTHCLFFAPHVKLEFDLHGQTPGLNSTNIPVNSRIATVQEY